MLSKVAERLYWTARYLERVENTARLLTVYDQLLYDLPRDIKLGWYNLIELNGCGDLFHERYRVQSEYNVAKFFLADDTNPNSMLSSLGVIRENVRTTRDALPEDAWEMINEFFLFAKANINDGINRSVRYEFLTEVIARCQMMYGMLSSTMRRDAGWLFINIGQNIEQADMTTRILDSGATALLDADDEELMNIGQIVWGHVLRSDTAYSAYRRTVKGPVSGPDVASFLLHDAHFPRSLSSCFDQIESAAKQLPAGESIKLSAARKVLKAINPESESDLKQPFRDQLNELQIKIIDIDSKISKTWFGLVG